MTRNFLFVTILILMQLSFTSCKTPMDPVVKGVNNFKVNRQNANKKIQYEFDLRVFNPNNFKVALLNHELDVYVNDRKIGRAESAETMKLKKLGEGDFHFVVESDLKKSLSGILGVVTSLFSGDKDVVVKLQGVVKARARGIAKKMYVEFDHPVKLNLPN